MPLDFFDSFVCNIEKLVVWCISAKESYKTVRKIALNFMQVSLNGVLLSGVFLPRKVITILRKIAVNFSHVSLKGVLLSVSVLECFKKKKIKVSVKKLNLQKTFNAQVKPLNKLSVCVS